MSGLALQSGWLPWLAGLGGLALGSFLNVWARSLAGGPSVLRRRSSCPHCGQRLSPAELIPVVSFLLQKGRCRSCSARLSLLYPLGEMGAALVLGLSAARFGFTPAALGCALFCLVLLMTALVDIQAGIVPDVLVLPGAALALAASPWLPVDGLAPAFIGCLGMAGALWALARFYRAARGMEGLGMGDVKLAGFMGAYLGLSGAGVAVAVAASSGLVFYLALWALGRVSYTSRLPFAPFLALGGAAAALWGEPINEFLVLGVLSA